MLCLDLEMEKCSVLACHMDASAFSKGVPFTLRHLLLGYNGSKKNGQHSSSIMNRLQLVEYPFSEVSWKQIGLMLGEEDAVLLPELVNESD